MKNLATVALAGFAGIVTLKLLLGLLVPLFALFLAIAGFALKLALVAAVAAFVWSLVRRRRGASVA